jgi:hypothetical protein
MDGTVQVSVDALHCSAAPYHYHRNRKPKKMAKDHDQASVKPRTPPLCFACCINRPTEKLLFPPVKKERSLY